MSGPLAFGFLLLAAQAAPEEWPRPVISRVYPLGAQSGTTTALEILGEFLANAESVEFDCRDLIWTRTTHATSGKLAGVVAIAPQAALGPHLLRVTTRQGYSTSAMFNVGQFPAVLEAEPNDQPASAQKIERRPAEIQGRLDGAADIDYYSVRVRAGQRWVFDLRAIEFGSALEARMFLLDASGKPVGFNDDRDDFDENPYLEHAFEKDGIYYVKLDQYRGPRGFNFGKNCAYILRISALPAISYVSPLGARRGRTARLRIAGSALGSVRKVYLTENRGAEYARMTYPYTVPIRFRPDPLTAAQGARIEGKIVRRTGNILEADFSIPAGTRTGLWRLRASGPAGVSDGMAVEVGDWEEYGEAAAAQAEWAQGGYVINGELSRPSEQDVFRIRGVAGQPLHFWTLAAQLGSPHLDSVLELRDATGKKLAENDDVVAGQGTLIGNPDSSLFYTPQRDGPLLLVVKDRMNRGGPGYVYRLKVAREEPGFQLFTTPENFTAPRGGSAEIKVHLIREAGFKGEVAVWFEGLPAGVEAPRGRFRADQLFEPNADGADMIIPEIAFRIHAPESLPAATYPIRVLGAAAADEARPGRRVVAAQTTLIMGPLTDLWNFVRRPLPVIALTVCEPFDARVTPRVQSISLQRGASATLELQAEKVPETAAFQVADLPAGVRYRLAGRLGNQVTVVLQATPEAPLGSFDISAEARLGDRRVASKPLALSILAAPQTREAH